LVENVTEMTATKNWIRSSTKTVSKHQLQSRKQQGLALTYRTETQQRNCTPEVFNKFINEIAKKFHKKTSKIMWCQFLPIQNKHGKSTECSRNLASVIHKSIRPSCPSWMALTSCHYFTLMSSSMTTVGAD
jgi:hypothetical protein